MVDTACSSSLVAVHLACKSLFSGECETAIVGSVKINILPIKDKLLREIGIESKSSTAQTFDDSSDGTGFGEGAVALLLKPLHKAVEDGDHIHAVIKGSAINQDGSSLGITAPNSSAQEDVILRAWKDVDVHPETITFIETHGTGTKLGDPVTRVQAIQSAFEKRTDKKSFCALGAIKTNIGHLDHASGLAGLVKTVLCMKHRMIPPNLHFQKLNKEIDLVNSSVYISDRLNHCITVIFVVLELVRLD